MNKLLIILLILIPFGQVNAQTTAELPHDEYRPFFKIAPYKRGFEGDSLNNLMQYLIEKPRQRWNRKDSIAYVMSMCHAGEFDVAFSIFERLKIKRLNTQEEYHIVQHMLLFKTRFFALQDWIDYETSDFPDFAEANAIRKRINEVNRLHHRREWNPEDSTVFPEMKDAKWKKMTRGSNRYMKELIPFTEYVDMALRIEARFESKRNPGLSQAFLEFGDFLHTHISLTDAYIAYSISRYYNKINNDAALKLKAIKAEMNRKNILFPSMRKIFPKQEKGVFNYKNIMEKRQKQRDSLSKDVAEPLIIPTEEPRFRWFTDRLEDIVKLVGLFLVLLVVAVFVKTK